MTRDHTAPTILAFGRDLLVRALLPAVALFTMGLGMGWVLSGPVGSSTGEDQLSVVAQSGRTPGLDALARTASAIGSVDGNIAICLFSVILVWLMSRRWWLAALPAVALALHVMVHLATSTLIARPRPPVETPLVATLDVGQPTASFPSGHIGATTAQLLVLALFLLQRVSNRAVRRVIVVVITGYLLVLGWSRVYLGMHHLSDVLWGAVNGVACGLIAWFFLRRSRGSQHEVIRSAPAVRG